MQIRDTLTSLAQELLGKNFLKKVDFSEISNELHRPKDAAAGGVVQEQEPEFDPATIEILPEYRFIVEAINQSCSGIFVTGKAGTGKSTLIKYLKSVVKNIAVVAPTAIAAINVEGVTIHSFFGIPPRPINPDEVFEPRASMAPVFENLKVLIVDEVSMVPPDIVDCIHNSLMKAKRNELPFGGVTVIFVGDILQLPPVVQDGEVAKFYTDFYESQYFYSAHVFGKVGIIPVELTRVFRQTDKEFVDALSRIRINREHRESVALLNRSCYRDRPADAVEDSLFLVPTNAMARSINERRLDLIDSQMHQFDAQISEAIQRDKMRFPAPATLNLKIGARIIFVHNNKPFWHNGTLGEIVEIDNDFLKIKITESGNIVPVSRHTWKKYKYTYDFNEKRISSEEIGSYVQFPISLGWAITIHKSQGMTLERVHIDLGNGAFCPGQTYVALSRCKTIAGLSLAQPISMSDVIVDATAIGFYERLRA